MFVLCVLGEIVAEVFGFLFEQLFCSPQYYSRPSLRGCQRFGYGNYYHEKDLKKWKINTPTLVDVVKNVISTIGGAGGYRPRVRMVTFQPSTKPSLSQNLHTASPWK